MRVRVVDVESDRYKIARTYMLSLKADDFKDKVELARLAQAANMKPSEFIERFGYLGETDTERASFPCAPSSRATRLANKARC
jgi:6-phosphofructokinase 1